MPFEIHRTLTLSTSHVDPREVPQLNFHASMVNEHGWLLFTGRDFASTAAAPVLVEAVKLAAREQCAFIRFDADGPVVDDLPTYDW